MPTLVAGSEHLLQLYDGALTSPDCHFSAGATAKGSGDHAGIL